MSLRTNAKRWLGGMVLVAAAFMPMTEAKALLISVGDPVTAVPAYVPAVLGPAQFLLPIELRAAADLQEWSFDLAFDPAVVRQVDVGGFYHGVYAALFSTAQPELSSIVSGGLLLDGQLVGVAGFSGGISGNGLLGYIAFEVLVPGQDPGFEVGNVPQPVPEPGTVALMGVGLALLAGRRKANSPTGEGADMKRKTQLVLTALAALCAWATPASAQTMANGPYYATPAWDQTLPVATRFIVLSNFKGEAVLDRETGLVWERAPSPVGYAPTLAPGVFGGIYASARCLSATTGGRMGWRQPSVAEMLSLIAPSASPGVPPALPAGHPFELGFSETFWTSTRYYADRYPLAYRTVSVTGSLGASDGGVFKYPVWCVRGGSVAAVD